MKKRVLLLICLLLLFPQLAVAAEERSLREQSVSAVSVEAVEPIEPEAVTEERLLEELDKPEWKTQIEAIEKVAEQTDMERGFSGLLREVLTGEFDFSFAGLKEEVTEAAFGEFRAQGKLLLQLVLVVLLSAMLKQLSDSFQGKSVGEMGFYVCYMVLVVVLLQTFYTLSDCVAERMRCLCEVYGAMVPLFLILSASSGNVAHSALLGPAIMSGLGGLSWAVSRLLLPAVLLAISLEIADHIAERPILGQFALLLRQCISWSMKGAAMVFMLLLSLQKIGGSAMNGLAAKTAKIAVNAVPVVGNVMGGAVETAAAVMDTLQSGTLVAAAVFLLLLCLPIVIKLVVILLVFRLTAAAAEFICEERLVECIAAAGEYTALLLGMIVLGEGMFLFSAVLLLGGV